jgi:hypothetical protein
MWCYVAGTATEQGGGEVFIKDATSFVTGPVKYVKEVVGRVML